MFNPDDIIARLDQNVSALKLVQGVMEFAALNGANPPVTPAAYVFALEEKPGGNDLANEVEQIVQVRFAVLFAVRNVADPRGEAARRDLQVLRDAVRPQLLGWMPPSCSNVCTLGANNLLRFHDGHVWWQDSYLTDYYVRTY